MGTAKLDAYLEGKRNEMIEDLKTLVRIDSTKGEALPGKPFGEGPAAALDAAGALMEQYGLKVTHYDHYVVAGDFGPAPKELDILAHMDVVPVSDEWTVTKPFEPLVVDGRIYGRGTADDKGPAIAALYAVRAIRELGLPLRKGVRIILGGDEECGSSDLEYYYARESEAPCTFSPDADFPLINLEKGRLASEMYAEYEKSEALPALVSLDGGDKVNIVPAKAEAVLAGMDAAIVQEAAERIAQETGVAFTVTREGDRTVVFAKGTAAHGSLPELGKNAVVALMRLVLELPLAESAMMDAVRNLYELFPWGDTTGRALGVEMADERSGALSMNLGIVHVNETALPAVFDCRAPICADDSNLTEPLRGLLASKGMSMAAEKMVPAHYVPEDLPFVQTLLRSYEKYTGKKGKALSTGGGTYVHELERGVAFGCMSEEVDNHMHGDDEFMEIDTMVMSAKIFADAILNICG